MKYPFEAEPLPYPYNALEPYLCDAILIFCPTFAQSISM